MAKAGSAGECFNPALYTPGTTAELEYVSVAPQTSGELRTSRWSAGSPVVFNGHGNIVPVVVDSYASYYGVNAFDLTLYGKEEDTASFTGSPSRKVTSVYEPPVADRMFSLVGVGDVDKPNPLPSDSIYNDPWRQETYYLGQERITVPAGTFDTCRFMIRHVTSNFVPTNAVHVWYLKGKGVVARRFYGSGNNSVPLGDVLKSGSINGVPL